MSAPEKTFQVILNPLSDERCDSVRNAVSSALMGQGFRVSYTASSGQRTTSTPSNPTTGTATFQWRDTKVSADENACACCHQEYKTPLVVSDHLWEKIRMYDNPKQGLCPTCTVERAAQYEEWSVTYLGGGTPRVP